MCYLIFMADPLCPETNVGMRTGNQQLFPSEERLLLFHIPRAMISCIQQDPSLLPSLGLGAALVWGDSRARGEGTEPTALKQPLKCREAA